MLNRAATLLNWPLYCLCYAINLDNAAVYIQPVGRQPFVWIDPDYWLSLN